MVDTKKDENNVPQFPINYRGRRMVYHTPLDKETNRPTDYIVAGTPGEPTIVGGAMLNYAGLAGKIVKGAKEGYDFLELDLWNDAEILEPHLAERIKQIRETHRMDLGIHLRVNLDLTSALGPIWDVNHKSLVTGVLGATEVVKANFILMHSAATPILEFGEAAARTAPSTLVTPWRDNLASFIESPLCFDHETRRRILKGDLEPRLNWNIYIANEENIIDKEKIDRYKTQLKPISEKHDTLPTLENWAISKFVKDIWFPGTIPQAEVMVAIKDVETMREVFDSDERAYNIFETWFDKEKGIWRQLLNKEIENKQKEMEDLSKKSNELIDKLKKEGKNKNEIMDDATFSKLNKEHHLKEEEINNFKRDYKRYYETIESNERQGAKPKDMFYNFFNDIIDLFKKSIGEPVNNDKGEPETSKYPFMTYEKNKKAYNDLIEALKILDAIRKKNHIKIKLFYERYSVADNFSYWIQKGSEGEEQIAYRTLAKWMYVIKDHLYEKIVIEDREVNDWWKENKKAIEKHKKELFGDFNGTDEDNKITFLDPDNIIAYTTVTGGGINVPLRKMVAAVSAKYIQGHLDRPMEKDTNLYLESSKLEEKHFAASMERQLKNMRKDPDGGDTQDNMLGIYEYMYKEGIHFYIETQDVMQEEWRGKVRIMSVTDHIEIIKAFHDYYKFDNVSYTMDFEHLTGNLLNPRQQIELLDDGDAKYISMIHINPPSATQGLHKIIKKMSFDVEYIYNWLHVLKHKGMSGAYFVWEMGKDTGGGTYEAPLAIRALAEELKKDTEPNKLPEKFFGIDANFYAMQLQAIKAHGLDPMREMFFYKPADFTFMGNMARATNAEIADRERLR
ncbi:MAG: hypothetical protein GQ477_00045 [Nanohaloarchaea archaeon]|nr:hypothetical protein [Candidatus Nanohaloarchaea archaeon]